MIYLTLGDQYSGVISSQVIDVCKNLMHTHGESVKLVSFVSLRNFGKQRQKFKKEFPAALVLPMWPKLENWKKNYFLLKVLLFFIGERKIMARGILACNLAIRLKENKSIDWVCFDARGAYSAEWKEYQVVTNPNMVTNASKWEQYAIQNSDFRLAVSQALIEYWQEYMDYDSNDHVIIPCTINQYFQRDLDDEHVIQKRREKFGYKEEDLIMVYAGSSAGWQSFQMIDEFISEAMAKNPNLHFLFLAKIELENLSAYEQYKDRIRKDWVAHNEIFQTLSMCDYGILIREPSITNQVAAPTKFGEYLAAGLKILITPKLGDYSEFVTSKNCGKVIENTDDYRGPFEDVSTKEKIYYNELAIQYFTKAAHQKNYKNLLTSSKKEKIIV